MNTKHFALFSIPLLALGLAGTAFAYNGNGYGQGEGFADCSLSTEEREAQRQEHEQECISDMAAITGISESEIENAFANHTSMRELFNEYGINNDEVHAELRAQAQTRMESHLEELVANGTITQTEANERLAHMEDRGMGGARQGGFGDNPRDGEGTGYGKGAGRSSEE